MRNRSFRQITHIPFIRTPFGAGVLLVLIILSTEFLIMLFIEGVFQSYLKQYVSDFFWNFLDPVLLTLICVPAINLLALRPMRTQQRYLEQQFSDLRVAAVTFESQDGIAVTDADTNILKVNHTFTQITGYSSAEVLGKKPSMLASGRQDAEFYRRMWESLKREKSWHGEIWNRRKNGEIYPEWLTITATEGDDGRVSNYVAIFSDITQRKVMDEKVRRLAFYDSLTNLPNRRLLLDRLGKALAATTRRRSQGALMFLDLDHFKRINDVHGHDIGDLLLVEVAKRLTGCIREQDSAARLGGDEFVVMLEGLSANDLEAAHQAEMVAEKIRAALAQPYFLKRRADDGSAIEHYCSSSIGVTVFCDQSGSVEELLKWTDMAMYQAKTAGRNVIRFFDPAMQTAVEARAALEADLRTALEAQQFRLHYQAQVDTSRRPQGAEALLRWEHPQRGSVAPLEFIPLAEETGQILQIGQWVLDTACAQLKNWQADPQFSAMQLAINVSAKQFRQPDFAEQVQATVHRHAINPLLLKLELTESTVLENIEDAIIKMRALKDFGIRFALDDFGTGHSSLSYLKRLPLDQIKIDQSFVCNIATDNGDAVMIMTIVDMGMNFELDVIAEGVETEEQLKLLQRYGCGRFQGYLFSKAVPVEQFETLLRGQ